MGSAASFGLLFRITTAGGVICSVENLGKTPLDAANLSRRRHLLRRPSWVRLEGRIGKMTFEMSAYGFGLRQNWREGKHTLAEYHAEIVATLFKATILFLGSLGPLYGADQGRFA